MIEFNNTDVMGFPGAIRGMRQPYKAVDRSDSEVCFYWRRLANFVSECSKCEHSKTVIDVDPIVGEYNLPICDAPDGFCMGPKDKELALKLCEAGPEHRKFLRMIHCQVDIKAPLYWWKQFDTYKIGTVANSESTMHTITKYHFEFDDFSCESRGLKASGSRYCDPTDVLSSIVNALNDLREMYLETKDQDTWKAIIELLPESYNQTRTVDLNYEVIRTSYHQRKNHKLGEWHKFCEWAEQLPYSEFITGKEMDYGKQTTEKT